MKPNLSVLRIQTFLFYRLDSVKMTRQCSLMKGAVEDEIKESAEISVINSELDSKEVKVAPFYVLVTFLTNIFCPWRS